MIVLEKGQISMLRIMAGMRPKSILMLPPNGIPNSMKFCVGEHRNNSKTQ